MFGTSVLSVIKCIRKTVHQDFVLFFQAVNDMYYVRYINPLDSATTVLNRNFIDCYKVGFLCGYQTPHMWTLTNYFYRSDDCPRNAQALCSTDMRAVCWKGLGVLGGDKSPSNSEAVIIKGRT